MNGKRKKVIIAIIALALIGLIGGTIAFFSNKGEFKNIFVADQLSVEASEDFTSPTNWLPGDTTEKVVVAHNTSKLPMAVRISYEERWEDQEGNPLPLEFEGEKAAIINLDNKNDWIPETKNEQTYYYYYKVLNPDEVSSAFMQSVTFNENAIGGMVCTPREDGRGEECKSSTDYEDANYYLNIKIEFIHFDKYKENWDTDVDISEKDRTPLYERLKEGAVLDSIKSTYVTSTSGVDFGEISSDTNGKGIYIRKGTENNEYPVYYYRGDVTDNNIIFADKCWKLVRTTDTGGTKIIYNGIPDETNEEGICANTGENQFIGTGKFSSEGLLAGIGYMYGERYGGWNGGGYEKFGKNISYSNGQYTLIDVFDPSSLGLSDVSSSNPIYKTALSAYHYACANGQTSCSTVMYVYRIDDGSKTWINLQNGETMFTIKAKMLANNNDAIIKQNIDNWYKENIQNMYDTYLEDTVWCNDRATVSGSFHSLTDSNYKKPTIFATNDRITKKSPLLTCSNTDDRFTTSTSIGNGNLSYPVGLLTADEILLAGSALKKSNSKYYLYSQKSMWTLSPSAIGNYDSERYPYNFVIAGNNGGLVEERTGSQAGIRPALSLKKDTLIIKGDGSVNNPYII